VLVTSADIPEVSWDYELKVSALKTAWWMVLGVVLWVTGWIAWMSVN
jgi:hypothetical protein